jgi:hypothetical protein
VGIALLAPLLLDLWERTRSEGSPGEGNACGAQRRRTFRFVLQAICLLPIACWGLLAWMACQWAAFGDPFAFARTQALWSLKPATATAELQGLLTLEPFWSVYEPWSDSWWARHEPVRNPLFSLQFANPLLFGAVAGLVGWGALRGGLDRYEVSLSLLLLLIPYATHAFRSGMTAHARYACVAFPAYAVVGHWCAVRPTLGAALAAVSAVLLFAYSALFSAWYRIL